MKHNNEAKTNRMPMQDQMCNISFLLYPTDRFEDPEPIICMAMVGYRPIALQLLQYNSHLKLIWGTWDLNTKLGKILHRGKFNTEIISHPRN
jgi:hypothetical protein